MQDIWNSKRSDWIFTLLFWNCSYASLLGHLRMSQDRFTLDCLHVCLRKVVTSTFVWVCQRHPGYVQSEYPGCERAYRASHDTSSNCPACQIVRSSRHVCNTAAQQKSVLVECTNERTSKYETTYEWMNKRSNDETVSITLWKRHILVKRNVWVLCGENYTYVCQW